MPQRFQTATLPALYFLFNAYQNNPDEYVDISATAIDSGVSPLELVKHLMDNGWIRGQGENTPSQSVSCAITLKGIQQIDDVYVKEKYSEVFNGLGEGGGKGNATFFLDTVKPFYTLAADVAHELRDKGLITIKLESRHDNLLLIEFTSSGQAKYETEKPEFTF